MNKVSDLRRCLHFCSGHRVALFNYVISILIPPWSSNQSKYQNDSIMFLKIIILLKNLPHKPYLCILANWFLRQMIILISCISPKTFLFSLSCRQETEVYMRNLDRDWRITSNIDYRPSTIVCIFWSMLKVCPRMPEFAHPNAYEKVEKCIWLGESCNISLFNGSL